MKERIRMQIQQPCHENWNNMTPAEQGRHCSLCRKTVVDFSIMSDREIMDYISQHAHGDTCGRLSDNQLNRIIERPRERTALWKYFWSVALSSLLLSYRSVAQQVKPPKSKTVKTNVHPKLETAPIIMGEVTVAPPGQPAYQIKGRVADEAGQPIAGAYVTLNNLKEQVTTDENGQFELHTQRIDKLGYSVSSVGYETMPVKELDPKQIKSLHVNSSDNRIAVQLKDLVLKKQYNELPQVIVIGYPTVGRLDITGGVTTIRQDSVLSKVQQKINALISSSYIKAYPNPVTTGGSFNVQFTMKDPGEYNVQFMDASGRIVGGKRLTITETGQVASFPAAVLPGQGAYFIRVVNKDGKVYSTKMIVQ